MRGERANRRDGIRHRHGSSPHARGTRRVGGAVVAVRRFIPACAGNARTIVDENPGITVHPRMRGERASTLARVSFLNGSSPHARGTPKHRDGLRGIDRFIPACAGNAWIAPTRCSDQSVHPRMRGERMVSPNIVVSPTGSSPHARGTPDEDALRDGHRRFIPACAGNAFPGFFQERIQAVHPRMRGERSGASMSLEKIPGSSPHARGTHFQ